MEIEIENLNLNNEIIDIRNSNDFFKEHYPKSINVPRVQLLKNPEKYLDKNRGYYLICDSGKISLSCAKILSALGFKCISIKGGIEKYCKIKDLNN